jgi:hypothetical protein
MTMKLIATLTLMLACLNKVNAQFLINDSTKKENRVSLGVSVFTGLGMMLNEPKTADFNTGSNYGLGAEIGYYLNKNTSVSSGFRLHKYNNTIKLNVDILPDFFFLNTSTIQIPIYFNHTFLNKRKKELLGLSLGVCYNINYYSTKYIEFIYKSPSTVPYREIEINTQDNDYSVNLGVYKDIFLNQKENTHMRVFTDFQLNIKTARFRDRVKDPYYTLSVSDDRFVPFVIRTGLIFTLKL